MSTHIQTTGVFIDTRGMPNQITMDYTKAIDDLKKADKIIKKRHRYACGLEPDSEEIKEERARFFFLSPDGQNGELFYELQKLGWRNAGRTAEYYWKMSRDGVRIEYVEGDVYLSPLKAE